MLNYLLFFGWPNLPESQCITFSKNCGLCAATGAFIPIGFRFGPASCAENIAASPNTATRPLPNRSVAP